MTKRPLGVLVSGSGSNLQALLDAAADPSYPARIAVVVSNVPTAFALERARRAGIPTEVVDHRSFTDRAAFDEALVAALSVHGVKGVCLAGFMRLVGPRLLAAFPDGVVNIHPALLPAFPGLHAPRQALVHGVKLAGCTVHFVDEGTDSGPIIGQAAVPVLADDTEEKLAARILIEEHQLYPACVRLWCEGRVRKDGRRVLIDGMAPSGSLRSLGR